MSGQYDFTGFFEGAAEAISAGLQASYRRQFERMKERGEIAEAQEKLRKLILFYRTKGGKVRFYEELALELFQMTVDFTVWTESGTSYGLTGAATFCSAVQQKGRMLFFVASASDVKRVHQHGGELEVSRYPAVGLYPVYVTGAEPEQLAANRYRFLPRSFRYGTAVHRIESLSR